jgi:HSP20 family protein
MPYLTSMTRPVACVTPDPLDALLRGWFSPQADGQSRPQIRIDVNEDARGYTVHADMPGVAKDAIEVTVDGNAVSISAEMKRQTGEAEGERALRRERVVGRMTRSFTLEHALDETAVTARYQDGVLELVLPKKAVAEARRISIQ